MTALATLIGTCSYNGLTFGTGTDLHIGSLSSTASSTSIALLGSTGLTGVNDLPAVRSSDMLRAQDVGAWQGFDFVGPRSVHLELQIIAADNVTLYNDVALLEAAFQPRRQSELPLLLFNQTRQINCRVRARSIPYDTGFAPRVGGMTVELFASDPRVYDATQTVLVLTPASGGGGVSWPGAWPWSWGGASTGGTANAVNAGNFSTRPVIAISGPCTNPYLQNVTTGQTLNFSIVLGASDVLTVDLDARSVVLNGTASRRSALVAGSAWWELGAGTSSVLFGAATVSGGCQATITYQSAWL